MRAPSPAVAANVPAEHVNGGPPPAVPAIEGTPLTWRGCVWKAPISQVAGRGNPRWSIVSGDSWGFGLNLKFAKATYWVWPRATDDQHRATPTNSKVHTTLTLH